MPHCWKSHAAAHLFVSEKAMVMEMIHTAMASQQDYYQRDYQPEFIEENKVTKLPPINEKKDDGPKFINRYL